jgi:uncharacterized protein YciI
MATYIVQLEFGIDEEKRMQVRPAHRDYLRTLLDQGKLITAGPWADETGALLQYEVLCSGHPRASMETGALQGCSGRMP